MDVLDTAAAASFMDDLLDFDDLHGGVFSCQKTKTPLLLLPSPQSLSDSFVEEEELEWISNKNAFPMVESLVDIIPNHPSITSTALTHHSPVSVLETSCGSTTSSGPGPGPATVSLSGSFKVPGKARSKQLRKRRRDMAAEQWHSWAPQDRKPTPGPTKSIRGGRVSSTLGRKCLHCQAEKTPQWRAGPYGPKTLCNACGVRYKSGRLVPEYRPASSPTFSSQLHSNSHRKIMEMRKHKTTPMTLVGPGSGLGQVLNKPTKEEIG